MRLGILASEMQGERTGVGRYVEGLLTGLSATDFDGEVNLFFQGARFEHALWSDPRFRLSFAGASGRSAVLWEQLSLPRLVADAGLDAFLGPAYSLPPRLPCPSLVALHDLSFEVLPQEFGWRERWRRRLLARRAARQASRVLTLSRAVARQIEQRYGVAAERIDVLPLAVDEAVFAATRRAGEIEAPSGERVDGPYVLYLGTILPRRRVDLLVEAFAPIARDRPDLHLVIAGANRLPQPEMLHDWVESAGLLDRVIDLGWVPERELPSLLAGAELSFYLSTYEGFGLPPMESLAAGTPPIVSRGLGLDDLWPDYPFRCQRLDAGEIERVTRLALD
ncbi:MAG TPA: glycosyltransferase family 1 protein, partial [Thermoanaerobaculia bacterium]|nr:glycosyltransferase family 1 protein [Thermoanaerobaculia bacterium]